MTLAIVNRSEVNEAVWDAFVDASDEAWLYHRHAFGPLLACWPNHVDDGFAVVDQARNDRILAVAMMHHNATYYAMLWMPACDNALPPKTRDRVLKTLYAETIRRAETAKVGKIISFGVPMTPVLRGERCPRVNPLLQHGFQNTLTQTYAIDLRGRSEEDLWQGLAPHCRTHIRKALKEGLTVRMAEPRDLGAYYAIHRENYGRNGVSPHPRDFFERIWDRFLSHGLARVYLAERDGRVIAANNEAIYKGAAVGWTATSTVEATTLGANNLLHWHAIRWARDNGLDWYDSGEGFPGTTDPKSRGLNDFKKSFGGELYPYYKGELDVPTQPPSPGVSADSPAKGKHARRIPGLHRAVRTFISSFR